VGKKELENDPLVGTIGRVLDAAFIDREDPKAAVEGLRKIEELAKKGISVLIAPEGTRMDTTSVGPFKKGPFRIAMAAGVPIVPVVIRNAEVIASKDSTSMNPGTVDVAVFPPISVADWTSENLEERIAAVRQLYLDALSDWPVDDLPTAAIYSQPPKKAPAKKAAAKKAPAKKVPAKKVPAKKAAAKKAGDAETSKPAKKPVRGRP
jgi:putative phosphoserine phosphatase/1-acylglycerol-3-phosphate O-acyltransferase